ncbi:hypothetical protein T4B_2221 [Trichinella pseudospiralis]|uniref:Uncharacterized protein n=1 Tax=Trichinella pseudospiralis TaxID=6337 RepID=A0A0V1HVV4_TRIPS|nr:hypothetical protein T4B_2221 [Trichinella pseudospiralis]
MMRSIEELTSVCFPITEVITIARAKMKQICQPTSFVLVNILIFDCAKLSNLVASSFIINIFKASNDDGEIC